MLIRSPYLNPQTSCGYAPDKKPEVTTEVWCSHTNVVGLIFRKSLIVNGKLEISTAPTKAKWRKQLIHRHLSKTKSIDRRSRSRESDGKTVRRWMVFGVEKGREVGRRG